MNHHKAQYTHRKNIHVRFYGRRRAALRILPHLPAESLSVLKSFAWSPIDQVHSDPTAPVECGGPRWISTARSDEFQENRSVYSVNSEYNPIENDSDRNGMRPERYHWHRVPFGNVPGSGVLEARPEATFQTGRGIPHGEINLTSDGVSLLSRKPIKISFFLLFYGYFRWVPGKGYPTVAGLDCNWFFYPPDGRESSSYVVIDSFRVVISAWGMGLWDVDGKRRPVPFRAEEQSA